MIFRTSLLLLGLLVFVASGLSVWFVWFLQKIRRREPIPPVRNAFQLLVFASVVLIWLSAVVMSEGTDAEDLVCLWVIMAPGMAFGGIMAYLGNKRRNISLQEGESNEKS